MYEFGDGLVVKVPLPETPDEWIVREATLIEAVRSAGVSAPRCDGIVEIDGRPCLVLELIVGPLLWAVMLRDRNRLEGGVAELARLQVELAQVRSPVGLPRLCDVAAARIRSADGVGAPERIEALALLGSLPDGDALLHGDLHPGNVIVGPGGPVIIDWCDASVGNPMADIVRTSIMLRPSTSTPELPHLTESTPDVMSAVRHSYLDAVRPRVEAAGEECSIWEAVLAVGRLSEGVEYQQADLLELWQRRTVSEFPRR